MTATESLDRADLRILEILQDDIPVTSRPYDAIAARAGISPDEALLRIRRLQESGIILSISPILESRSLGIRAATLVALRVPEEQVRSVAGIISSYPEVSHNYRRDHPYGIWFTLAAETPGHLADVLREIQEKTGVPDEDVLNLPTVKKFKIDLRFAFTPESPEVPVHGQD